jgi:hypothetical protein
MKRYMYLVFYVVYFHNGQAFRNSYISLDRRLESAEEYRLIDGQIPVYEHDYDITGITFLREEQAD